MYTSGGHWVLDGLQNASDESLYYKYCLLVFVIRNRLYVSVWPIIDVIMTK